MPKRLCVKCDNLIKEYDYVDHGVTVLACTNCNRYHIIEVNNKRPKQIKWFEYERFRKELQNLQTNESHLYEKTALREYIIRQLGWEPQKIEKYLLFVSHDPRDGQHRVIEPHKLLTAKGSKIIYKIKGKQGLEAIALTSTPVSNSKDLFKTVWQGK